jgi:energy-coupling factor transporter ATP-binding protein EcfA2
MSSTPPSPPAPQKDKNKNSWLPIVVLTLAGALNVPPAIIAFTTHFVNQHPWWSLLILLGFAIFDFAAYIIARLWQRLEGPWLDAIAHVIDYRVRSIFSGYYKRYCKYLIYQHRDFDVKGLSLQGPFGLELDQAFIELSIGQTTMEQMSANPIPQKLREGSHSIWDYLASTYLTKQHLVIVGAPGSGKTTLLKHITLMLLAHGKGYHIAIRVPRKLPMLLFLRDHAKAIHTSTGGDKSAFTLVEALHDHLKRWEQPDPPAGWVKHQLDNGRCLVLLDGLDEVADPQVRKEVVSWVQIQMAAFRDNRFIITSRPFGFRDNPLSGVAMLEARPFTPEQVERFIHKWYLANEIMSKQKDDEGVQMRARADAKGLLQQLYSNPALLALTVNPLLLTMIAIVHRYRGSGKLPENRVSLYANIFQVFLGSRQEARGQQLELKPEQIQLVLEPLACYMMFKGLREITPAQARTVIEESLGLVNAQMSVTDFLKLVENVSGLLLERESGIYSFAHLTFQEYLAAMYIREKRLVNILITYVSDIWWQESIRLYCAMADATPIIEACLVDNPPSIPALILAFDCQKDALTLQAQSKAHLETILSQGMEDTDTQRQHIAAEVLLARRLRQMVYLKENIFIDTSLITCAEYQLFLDEQRGQRKYNQPDHWQSYRFSPGQGSFPVTGIRSSDAVAFCDWLTGREAGSWYYRLPFIGELKQIGDDDILNSFPAGLGYWSHTGFVWLKEPLLLPRAVIQGFIDLDLARVLDRDLARILDLDRARDRVRVLDLDRVRVLAPTRDLDSAPAYVLDRALDRNRDRILDLALARALARSLALDLIHTYNNSLQKKSSGKQARDKIQNIIDVYLDIYITLVILEVRIQGKLPSCESILIVKERKQENA